MGNVSSVSQTIKNDVINSFNSNCTNSVNITQTIEGIDFTGDCDNVNIENLASTSAECDMSQCAKTLAEYYNKATTDQKTAMDLFNISEKSENIVTDTVNSFDENLPNEIISEISKVSEDIENLLPSIPIPTIHQNIISPCDSTAPDGTRLNCLYKPDVSAEQWTMDDYEFARNAFAIGCNQYSYYGNCEGMYAKLFLAYENLSGK